MYRSVKISSTKPVATIARSPEPVQVVVSGDLVADLRALHAAGLRAPEAEAVQLPRLLPRAGAAKAGPRLGGRRRAVTLLGHALAPDALHGRRRVRHVAQAAPGVPARSGAPPFRRRAEVAREHAEAGRVVGCLGERGLVLLEARCRLVEVQERRRDRRVGGGVPARDAGRPAAELACVHLHDPRAALEGGVPAVGQPPAVYHRKRQRLHARILRTNPHLFCGFPGRRRLEGVGGGLEPHERLQPAQSRGGLLPHEVATYQSLQLHERLESTQGLPSQVASEGLLDHDGGLHLALLAAVARPHLRQLSGGDGGHRGPPASISHAVPRLREAPPPLLHWRYDTTAGARGITQLLAIPVPFLLAGEHLLEPRHCAAHGGVVLHSS
uniref:Uncharacterized protein n=1 Tax=Arundo donax TaxID=35708 RepID=A0A0A9F0Y5_ARUDO